MSGSWIGLAVAVYLACTVEAVEALTVVLALGTTRGWRAPLYGAGAAVLALCAVVAVLGPAVGAIPLGPLRVVVGGLLLIFGLQWLRKAILRAAGLKATHDELAAFAATTEHARAARASDHAGTLDRYAFAVSAKVCLLEGLEVVFIVLTFGVNQHRLTVAAAAALVAVAVVAAVGVAVRAPLARVPENAIKFVVGVMLTSFGTFWSAEGAGAHWPGGDASLPGLIVVVGLAAVAIATYLRDARVTATDPGPAR